MSIALDGLKLRVRVQCDLCGKLVTNKDVQLSRTTVQQKTEEEWAELLKHRCIHCGRHYCAACEGASLPDYPHLGLCQKCKEDGLFWRFSRQNYRPRCMLGLYKRGDPMFLMKLKVED